MSSVSNLTNTTPMALPKAGICGRLLILRTALIGLCLMAVACAHYPLNAPLSRYAPDRGYRFETLEAGSNTDSLFICLAFSGGGTRAAAFAYGVLSRLASIPVVWNGQPIRLLDEVDCISSVSGGSFTAAHYALYRDAIFKDFGDRFLYRDIEWELLKRVLNPLNWVRLASPYFSRIDLAAELYDETIYGGQTFGHLLARKWRPLLIINATHMQLGERFEFTQDRFDFLGSDLLAFPIGRAVAASSAFPFLLSPISLQNLPPAPGFTVPEAVSLALNDYYINPRRYTWAKHLLAYTEKQAHPYVHLMDGGLADNIGLRAIVDEYSRGFIRDRLSGTIKKLVIISVNARTAPSEDLDTRQRPPGLATVAYKTATVSMDNYSFETVELMRELAGEREKAQLAWKHCQEALDARCPGKPPLPPLAGGDLESYVIELNFDGVKDQKERQCFLGLPTSFVLPRHQVTALIEMAGELLDAHPKFQELLQALNVRPDSVKSPTRTARCVPSP
jgi:NTE family protein